MGAAEMDRSRQISDRGWVCLNQDLLVAWM